MAELTKLYDSSCAQYLMALHRRTCLCSVLNHTIFEWLLNSIFPLLFVILIQEVLHGLATIFFSCILDALLIFL